MKYLIGLLMGLLVATLMLAFTTKAVMAQEKAKMAPAQEKMKEAKKEAKAEKGKTVIAELLENDKVRVFKASSKPGDENLSPPYPSPRVIIALKGGTSLRTYADGKTEKVEYKTGEVKFFEPSKTAFTVKNIGKAEYVLYVVVLK